MKKIKVKPLPNRIVLNPKNMKPIKAEGEEVTLCPQIKRYIKFGDLEVIKTKTTRKK